MLFQTRALPFTGFTEIPNSVGRQKYMYTKDGRFQLRNRSRNRNRLQILPLWNRSRNRNQLFFPYWNRSRNRNQNNGPESEPESCIMVSVFYQVILALQNEGDIKYHEVYQLIWNRNRNRNRSQNSWNQNRNLSHVIIFKWSRNRSRNQSARVESESEPGPSGTAHL